MGNTESDMIGSNSSSCKGNSITSSNQATTRRNSSLPYKILIVDDEQDIAFSYKSILEGAGFKVDVYNDPLAALSKLKEIHSGGSSSPSSFSDNASPPSSREEAVARTTQESTKQPYDLLLLDIRMPKMNGFELYREIKKIMNERNEEGEEGDSVKVCFITAYEVYYEQLKEEFPMVNVGCFIKKPIDAADLIKRIKQELLLQLE